MPRTLDITAPSDTIDALLNDVETLDEVIGVHRQRGASLTPEGDLLSITVTNEALHPLMRMLVRHGIGTHDGTAVTTSQPVGVISPHHRRALASGRNEASWEEMERILTQDGGATVNTVILMSIAGALAAVGLSQGTLHVIVGAMVIAPGFEPLVRMALGVVAGNAAWWRGLSDLAISYASLVAGAVSATLAVRVVDPDPLRGDGGYLDVDALVSFWSTTDPLSILVSLVAGVAGALVVATFRAVLTAGVMIALALIPSSALVGMALVAGEVDVLAGAALRWSVDVVLVLAASLLVLGWKRRTVHHRDTMM